MEPESEVQRQFYGEGDTYLIQHFLPDEIANDAFERVQKEVQWQTMHHHGGKVPRLVAVEGRTNEDGSFPIYRHPADEAPPLLPFSPMVSIIREHVEKALQHHFNHVLIQHYRTGNDYISEHSDKTIDVIQGSKIVNVSFGAKRLMVLRPKKDHHATGDATNNRDAHARPKQRIPLPHNSIFVLGFQTNSKWLHGIRQDKRFITEKSAKEVAFDGERISLTFRHIGTFLTGKGTHMWGQGCKGKTKEDMRSVVVGDESETLKLIYAFGQENQRSDFDWKTVYGEGSDVLHFTMK